jgi:hypothetical protein
VIAAPASSEEDEEADEEADPAEESDVEAAKTKRPKDAFATAGADPKRRKLNTDSKVAFVSSLNCDWNPNHLVYSLVLHLR